MSALRPYRAALLSLVLGVLALGPVLVPGRALLPADVRAYAPFAAELSAPDAVEVARVNARAVPHRMDRLLQFLPFDVAVAEAWRRGEVPLWEPGILCGIPLVGQATSRAFYPTALVFAALDPVSTYAWLYLAHLVLGGTCLYRLARRLGAEEPGALLGTASFVLSGYALAHVHHPMIFYAAVWALPALEATHAIVRPDPAVRGRRARLPVLGLALATALSWLAGFPQASVLLGYMVVGLALALALEQRFAGRRLPLGALARVGAGLALGTSLALVQVLPALSASAESSRAPAEVASAAERALAPAHLLELVLPGQLAPPGDLCAELPDVGPRPSLLALALLPLDKAAALSAGVFNHMETALGLGIWPLLFALLGARQLVRGERRAAAAFLWTSALFGLAVACALPPFAHAALGLPGFAVGDLKRMLLLPALCLPLLAALGWRPLGRRALATAALAGVAALVLGTLVLRVEPDGFARSFAERIGPRVDLAPADLVALLLPGEARANQELLGRGLCALGLALALAPLLRLVPRVGAGAWPLIALTAVELLPIAADVTPAPAARSLAEPPALLAPLVAQDDAAPARLVRFEPVEPGGARGFADVRLFPPNLPRVFGLADATGYAPLPPARVKRYFDLIEPGATSPGTGLGCLRRAESLDSPLLDLLGVGWVLASTELASPRWELVGVSGTARLYRRTQELPRARLLFRTRRVELDEVAGVLAAGLDPLAEALLEPETTLHGGSVSGGAGVAHVVHAGAQRIELEVECDAPALLALADAWSPGWKYAVDDEPERDAFPVHVLLRGAEVPAGRHRVTFRYAPAAFVRGAVVSLAALAAALLWMLLPESWIGRMWSRRFSGTQ